jgi:flagellin
VNNDLDRKSLNEEVKQLIQEVDRIAKNTSFNGNKLLDGSVLNKVLQVGANIGETLSIGIKKADADELARQMRRESAAGVDTNLTFDTALGQTLNIAGVISEIHLQVMIKFLLLTMLAQQLLKLLQSMMHLNLQV